MCTSYIISKRKVHQSLEKFIMKLSNLQIVIVIFMFLALQENSFSLARRVKKVHAVTTKKEMAVEFFSFQKEIIPVESYSGGRSRKMRGEAMKSKKVRSKSGEEEEADSIDNLMAFSSDYHPPKPHPPKNN